MRLFAESNTENKTPQCVNEIMVTQSKLNLITEQQVPQGLINFENSRGDFWRGGRLYTFLELFQ